MFTVTRISLIVYMLKCSYYREREITLKTQVFVFNSYNDKSINNILWNVDLSDLCLNKNRLINYSTCYTNN